MSAGRWLVTEVHKVAGRLDSEARTIELTVLDPDRKVFGAQLRKLGVLSTGQSIREIRHTREFWREFTVFPNGGTTHSFLFKFLGA